MTTDIKSYLAGLFDGEGCVHIYCRDPKPNTGNFTARLSVTMTAEGLVRLFSEHFGGRVRYDARRFKYATKDAWTWYVTNAAEVKRVAEQLYAHCRLKKYQLSLVIEACESIITQKKRGSRRGIPTEVSERRVWLAAEARRAKVENV